MESLPLFLPVEWIPPMKDEGFTRANGYQPKRNPLLLIINRLLKMKEFDIEFPKGCMFSRDATTFADFVSKKGTDSFDEELYNLLVCPFLSEWEIQLLNVLDLAKQANVYCDNPVLRIYEILFKWVKWTLPKKVYSKPCAWYQCGRTVPLSLAPEENGTLMVIPQKFADFLAAFELKPENRSQIDKRTSFETKHITTFKEARQYAELLAGFVYPENEPFTGFPSCTLNYYSDILTMRVTTPLWAHNQEEEGSNNGNGTAQQLRHLRGKIMAWKNMDGFVIHLHFSDHMRLTAEGKFSADDCYHLLLYAQAKRENPLFQYKLPNGTLTSPFLEEKKLQGALKAKDPKDSIFDHKKYGYGQTKKETFDIVGRTRLFGFI